MKKVLVTGATGFVGQRVCRDLVENYRVFGTCREYPPPTGVTPVYFEAESDPPEALVAEVGPDVLIHLLARSRGEACAEKSKLARRINTEVTLRLGAAARDRGIATIFTSTDLVFDGRRGDYTERSRPSATGVYARTKIEAEEALREVFAGCEDRLTVFRLALSYGWSDAKHPGPIGWIVHSLREGKPVTLFRDEFRNPLFVGDISRAATDAIEKGISGLYHLAGRDKMDRYTMGVLIAERFGLDAGLCLSGSVEDYTGAEPRSPDCSMRTEKFQRVFGWRPIGVEEGLSRMVKEREEDG